MKVAIKSNKRLMFPPASIGYVEMEIDLIQNKPGEGLYNLRIVDTCFDFENKEVLTYDKDGAIINDADGNPIMKTIQQKKILEKNIRQKSYTYEDLSQLGQMLNVDFSEGTMTDNINHIFEQGLLITTQMECRQGLTGEGKGMYFSEVQDWEIVTETTADNG